MHSYVMGMNEQTLNHWLHEAGVVVVFCSSEEVFERNYHRTGRVSRYLDELYGDLKQPNGPARCNAIIASCSFWLACLQASHLTVDLSSF